MMLKRPHPYSIFLSLCLVILILVVGCMPVPTQGPQAPVEPATPTPEIFNPLDPSPTLSESDLPMTCQVTDLNVYVNKEWGYCFAYPLDFDIDASRASEAIVTIHGPALEDNANPVRASLELSTQLVSQGSTLTPLVDAFLTSFGDIPQPIQREPAVLGNVPAEKLEPVPGLLSSRVIIALHESILFTLRFHPSDLEIAKEDLEELTQTVTGSFAFLPPIAQPVSRVQTVSWYEFDREISLSYDSLLAPWVEGWTVPAVPVSDQVMFSESQPSFAQIRFLGFQGGRAYDLPIYPVENRMAQVRVYRTADFAGYGDDAPTGFLNQLQALKDMLQRGIEPARCVAPVTGEPVMPFLPWVNSRQTFCAQPEILEFNGGRGIRYLTYYSQDPSPVLDQQVFYTFQGLTDDGQFYIAAFFPVQTGIFPTEPPACPECSDPNYNPIPAWTALLTGQVNQLNAQSADEFAPSLKLLDNVIQSIRIGQ